MTTAFKPKNDLENLLMQAQEGTVSPDEFMNTLIQSQVFMPVRDKLKIVGFQDSKNSTPLALQDDQGTNILVIFTSSDRATQFLQSDPDFQGGLIEKAFGELLEINGVGYGVTINPGEEVGMDLDPDMVEEIVGLRQAASH